MAKAKPTFPFIGTFGNLSVYKRHDMEEHIVRSKGGPSKQQVLKSPQFENTRRNNKEFGGRARASRFLLQALEPIRPTGDYNIAGPLNALVKPVQALDPTSEWGKRHIILNKNPQVLEGFSISQKYPLESIIRNNLRFTMNKQTLESTVEIPALVPGINFHVPGKYPLFSLVFNPVIVPDLYYSEEGYKPSHKDHHVAHHIEYSEWYPVLNGSPAISKQSKIQFTPPDENFIFILSVGIRFGTIGANGEVKQLPRTGAGKIIGVV